MSRTQKTTQLLSPEYIVLGLLKLQPSHGYALHQRLETALRQVWRISLSQVYNILHRLDKQGFIQEAGDVSAAQDMHRVPFRVTEAGDQHFETWMQTPFNPSVRAIRMAFITKLYFAERLGRSDLQDLIDAQRSVINIRLEKLSAQANSVPKTQIVNFLGLQLRIKQLESLEIWFEETINDNTFSLENKT